MTDVTPEPEKAFVASTFKGAPTPAKPGASTISPSRGQGRPLRKRSSRIEERDGCYFLGDERISNFLLEPKFELVLENGERSIAADLIFNSKRMPLDLTNQDLLSPSDLLKRLGSPYCTFTGRIQSLRTHLYSKPVPERHAVTCAGRHGNLIVTPELTIGPSGPTAGDVQLINRRNSNVMNHYPKVWPSPAQHLSAAEVIFAHFPRVNRTNISLPLLGWIFALPFLDLIRSALGGFPCIVGFGPRGSGKTQLAKLAARVAGAVGMSVFRAAEMTRFVLMLESSSTNLVPLVLDEYRRSNRRNEDLLNFIRNSYGGYSDARGTADQRAISYSIQAPLILCGEDRIRDASSAIDERAIQLRFSKETVEREEYRASFARLQTATLEHFAPGYWSWALTVGNFEEALRHSQESVERLLPRAVRSSPSRVRDNAAIVHFGLTVAQKYAQQLALPDPMTPPEIDEAIVSVLSESTTTTGADQCLEELLQAVGAMIAAGKIRFDTYFAWTSKGTAVARFGELVPEVLQYLRQSGHSNLLGQEAYLGEIKAIAGKPDSFIIRGSAKARFRIDPDGREKQVRGFEINASLLASQTGIELREWDASIAEPELQQDPIGAFDESAERPRTGATHGTEQAVT